MTLQDLKALFRKFIKLVPGGPANLTRGVGMLNVLDALAEELKTGGYQTLTLLAAQQLPVDTPPAVGQNVLYGITGDWNATGTDSTVWVLGVRPDAYHTLGLVYDAQGAGQLVEVDVAAGGYQQLSADDLLPKDNDWMGLNDFKIGQINLGPVGLGRSNAFGQPDTWAVQVNDGRPNFFVELQALNTYSLLAPQELNSHTKLAAALQQVSFVTGAKILWVQGGLNNYNPTRGNPQRPYATLQNAHDAALDGDLILVLPGGSGTDAFGRATYTESFQWSREVRIIFAPGAIHAGLFQCNSFLGTVASRRELIGGEFLGRMIHWRQLNVENFLLVRNARFTGLGTFEVNGTGTANDAVIGRAVLRNCEFDSKLPAGSQAPVRVIGRDDMGPVVLELDNTLVVAPETACVSFQANGASRLVLRGTTELRGPVAYDNRVTSPGMVLIPQNQWLQDLRPSGGGSGGSGGGGATLLTGTYTAGAPGAQTIPVAGATAFFDVGIRTAGGKSIPLDPGTGYTVSAGQLTILAAAGVQAQDVLTYSYATGGAQAAAQTIFFKVNGGYTAGGSVDGTISLPDSQGAGFQTVPFDEVLEDVRPASLASGWNPATSSYTIQQDGLYELIGKFRLRDGNAGGPAPGQSYGMGVNVTNNDNSDFSWFQTANSRNSAQINTSRRCVVGDKIRLYVYLDGFGGVCAGMFSVRRIG